MSEPEPDLPRNRVNDGKCDSAGRFWAGTMQDGGGPAVGSLYRVERKGGCTRMLDGLMIPNGIAWSPAGRALYMADSGRNVILKFPFDADEGEIGPASTFVSTAGHPGKPDGAAIDADGCLWSAEYGGGRLVRYTPAGQVDRVIALPVTLTTSCAFGGTDLDTLYVTTARQTLSPLALASQPLAGAVLAIRPGVRGLADHDFDGD